MKIKFLILTLLILAFASFAFTQTGDDSDPPRPTNTWKVVYRIDEGTTQTETLTAGNANLALATFDANHQGQIYYVTAVYHDYYATCTVDN